eukprot:COSAG02_NODE_932_length_15816_cov_15.913088_7_plen_95_part_00
MRILHCRMRILHCRMRIRRELEYKYEICCNAAGDEYELETCLGAGAVGDTGHKALCPVSLRPRPGKIFGNGRAYCKIKTDMRILHHEFTFALAW